MKNKMRIWFLVMALACTFLAGCGGSKSSESNNDEADVYLADEEDTTNLADESILPDDLPLEFLYTSGVGAWETTFTLEQDGTFQGKYQDSDSGETGDEYPGGTIYISEFSGTFTDISKVDDFTYVMTLEEVNTTYEEGQEWIEDEIRYVATKPFGLESGKEFYLYTPDTPVENLPDDFWEWYASLNVLPDTEVPDTLSCYGIYNKEMQYTFFVCE